MHRVDVKSGEEPARSLADLFYPKWLVRSSARWLPSERQPADTHLSRSMVHHTAIRATYRRRSYTSGPDYPGPAIAVPPSDEFDGWIRIPRIARGSARGCLSHTLQFLRTTRTTDGFIPYRHPLVRSDTGLPGSAGFSNCPSIVAISNETLLAVSVAARHSTSPSGRRWAWVWEFRAWLPFQECLARVWREIQEQS